MRLARPDGSTNRLYITFTWWRQVKEFSKTSAYQVHLLIYWLTSCNRVFLEKLTVSRPVKKFPAFYGTRRFITAFTSVRHLSLSWATSIQSMSHLTHFLKIQLNIILPSMPGHPSGLFSLGFPTTILYTPSSPKTYYMPAHLILLEKYTSYNS